MPPVDPLAYFRDSPSLARLADEAQSIRESLDHLEEAKRTTWAELLHHIRNGHAAADLDELDLAALAESMAAVFGDGYSRFWDAHMPPAVAARKVKAYATSDRYWRDEIQRNRPNGTEPGTWEGTFPLDQTQPAPLLGQAVVYHLYDDADTLAYIGSTAGFRSRMRAHRREKPGLAYWTARLCRDRETAYQLEEQLLRQHMPHLNRKRGR